MAKYSILNIEFSTPPDLRKPCLNDDGSFISFTHQKNLKLDQETALCRI